MFIAFLGHPRAANRRRGGRRRRRRRRWGARVGGRRRGLGRGRLSRQCSCPDVKQQRRLSGRNLKQNGRRSLYRGLLDGGGVHCAAPASRPRRREISPISSRSNFNGIQLFKHFVSINAIFATTATFTKPISKVNIFVLFLFHNDFLTGHNCLNILFRLMPSLLLQKHSLNLLAKLVSSFIFLFHSGFVYLSIFMGSFEFIEDRDMVLLAKFIFSFLFLFHDGFFNGIQLFKHFVSINVIFATTPTFTKLISKVSIFISLSISQWFCLSFNIYGFI